MQAYKFEELLHAIGQCARTQVNRARGRRSAPGSAGVRVHKCLHGHAISFACKFVLVHESSAIGFGLLALGSMSNVPGAQLATVAPEGT